MSLYSKFYGNTQTIGTTLFDSRAILNVQEGYRFGGTIEYINKGDFEVEDMDKTGAFSQKFRVIASHPLFRLDVNSNLIPRVYQSKRELFNNLANDNDFLQDFSVHDGSWGATNSRLRITNPTGTAKFATNDMDGIENFRLIVELKSNLLNSQSFLGLLARHNINDGTGYVLRYWGGDKQIGIGRRDGTGGATLLVGLSIGLTNNTLYNFMFVGTQGNLRGYWGTTNTGMTLGVSVTDYTYTRGSFGTEVSGTSSIVDLKNFDLTEIGDAYTRDDILRNILAMGDVWNVKTYTEGSTISVTGGSNAGSSWIYGVSNGERFIDLVNTSSGQSWHILPFSPVSNNDLNLFDSVDIKGTSGNIAGFGYQVFRFGGGSLNNWLEDVGTLGTSRVLYTNRSQYITLQPDRWYTLKMRFYGSGVSSQFQAIDYFVNNMLVGSLPITNSPQGAVPTKQKFDGLMGFRTGVSGTKTIFKNFKTIPLREVIPVAQIDPGQQLSSAFARFMAPGDDYIAGPSFIEIYKKGSSREGIGLTDISKSQIINNQENLTNNRGAKHVLGFTSNDIDISYQDGYNKRVAYQTDSARYSFMNDQTVQTQASLNDNTFFQMVEENRDIERLELVTVPRIQLEKFDQIGTVGDTYLGLSVGRSYLVESFTTEADFGSGTWRQSLIITDQQ